MLLDLLQHYIFFPLSVIDQ